MLHFDDVRIPMHDDDVTCNGITVLINLGKLGEHDQLVNAVKIRMSARGVLKIGFIAGVFDENVIVSGQVVQDIGEVSVSQIGPSRPGEELWLENVDESLVDCLVGIHREKSDLLVSIDEAVV